MTQNSPQHRYVRQQQFAPLGAAGQARIAAADVAIVGCGALGTVAAEILARGGVGRLRLIDRDIVEWTNLQRQSLYLEVDAREAAAKAEAAAGRLAAINSQIEIIPEVVDVTGTNIRRILDGCDFVIDASDNFGLRFLVNDWSLATKTPWVHGGCVGATGQVRLFTGIAPCFRCLVPTPPPIGVVETCDTAGILGAASHLIASLQAAEAFKWLSGNRDAVRAEVLSVDLWNNRIRSIALEPSLSRQCPACGRGARDFLEATDPTASSAAGELKLCGRDTVQICSGGQSNVDFEHIENTWREVGRVKRTRFFIRLWPDETHTLTLFRDGRALVAGTEDLSKARSLFTKYVGN